MKTLTYLALATMGVVGAALVPTTSVASTPPCGTDAQCAAESGSCPASAGWIYLTEKTVRCCRPLASDPREYFLYDYTIKVYNKVSPGQNERCYRLISWTNTGVRCSPVACVAEPEILD